MFKEYGSDGMIRGDEMRRASEKSLKRFDLLSD